jgi:CheY-like chemotaxis protein
VINGRAEMGLLQSSNQDPLYQNLYEILQSGRHASDLVRQLLAFGRRQAITRVPMDLNSTIRNLERMLRRLIGEDIFLATRLAPDLPAISADPSQLEQILLNLTVNARDALRERNSGPGGPRITIETGLAELDETSAATRLGNRTGPHAVLAVSDTGVGMSEETRNHIFEPFFTTKPPGQGTGLGLATVFGIVQQNEGSISVYSEPGVGTTIRIYWPVSALPVTEPLPEAKSESGVQGQETLLVVEDDARTRKLAVEALRGFGYRVLHAADGIEALQRVSEAGVAIDLLLTDVIMPRQSGVELAAVMRRSRPGLRVLFTSGYTDRHLVGSEGIQPTDHFLAKPFTIQALARKVREVLDRPAE